MATTASVDLREAKLTTYEERKRAAFNPWKLYCAFRDAKIITVEPVIFFFMFANFLFTPLYQQYYYVRYGEKLLENTSFPFPNGSFCLNSSEVDKYAPDNKSFRTVETFSDHLVIYGQLANRLPAVFTTILIGPLSDRFGRKPIILAAGAGRTLSYALALVIVYFNLNPYYFILANFLSGLMGDFPAMIAGTSSYLADISSPKWRSFRIGVATGLISLGGLAGQLANGYWLSATNCDFVWPMWAVLGSSAAAVVYVVLFLPESLSRKAREELATKNPKGLKALTQGFRIFIGLVPNYSVWRLWFSMIAICMLLVTVTGWEYTNVYFLKAPPFDFNPITIGVYQAVYSASRVASTFLLGILVAIKTSDPVIALIGLTFNAGCNALTGFSRKLYQVFAIASIQGVDSITWAGIRGYMSNLVAAEDQGALFAMIASFEAIASLIASVVWPLIYPITLNHHLSTGTTFFFMAGVMVLTLPFVIALVIFQRRDKNRHLASQRNSHAGSKQSLLSEQDPLLGYSVNSRNDTDILSTSE